MTYQYTLPCPECDAEVPLSPNDKKVACPGCATRLVVNEDAEFIDGAWRNLSTLYTERNE